MSKVKLMIEIDEEVYTDIKDGIIRKHIDKVFCSLANGTPLPKGEWKSKIIEVKKHYAECPFCGFSFEETSGRILPYFCGACGADMRKGGAEC